MTTPFRSVHQCWPIIKEVDQARYPHKPNLDQCHKNIQTIVLTKKHFLSNSAWFNRPKTIKKDLLHTVEQDIRFMFVLEAQSSPETKYHQEKPELSVFIVVANLCPSHAYM